MKEIIIAGKECLITPAGEDLASRVDVEQFISNPLMLRNYVYLGEGVETRGRGLFDISDVTQNPILAKWTINTIGMPSRKRLVDARKSFEALYHIRENDLPFTAPQSYIASDEVLIREVYPVARHVPIFLKEQSMPRFPKLLKWVVNLAYTQREMLDMAFESYAILDLVEPNKELLPNFNQHEMTITDNWFIVGDIDPDFDPNNPDFSKMQYSMTDPRLIQ